MDTTESQRTSIGFWLAVALLGLIAGQKVVLVDTIDPDAFWHLRVAEQIAREGPRPIVDELSYMSQREPWTPYSWLAELGMRAVWNHRGLHAAVIAHVVLAMLLVLISALACRDASDRGNQISVMIGVLVAGTWTQWFVAFRPVAAALFVMWLCAWLVLRDRSMHQRSRAIWLVPALVALCVNLHFFAVLIPCWAGALLVGAIVERDRRGTRRYTLLLLTSALALLATPMLPGMLRSIRNFASADPVVASGTIVEMTYIWRQPWGAVLAVLAAVTVAWLIARRKRISLGEWIWLIGMTMLAARFARFMPLFAMIAAPLLARTLPAMSSRVLASRSLWAMLAIVIAISGYRVIDGIPSSKLPDRIWLDRLGANRFRLPIAAADYVDSSIAPRAGHLINGFNWGGYLAWRLPQYKVMADARTQLYPDGFWKRFFFSDADPTRDALAELIATRGADAAILPRDDRHFVPRLLELGWKVAYQDDRAAVLQRPAHAPTRATIRATD